GIGSGDPHSEAVRYRHGRTSGPDIILGSENRQRAAAWRTGHRHDRAADNDGEQSAPPNHVGPDSPPSTSGKRRQLHRGKTIRGRTEFGKLIASATAGISSPRRNTSTE